MNFCMDANTFIDAWHQTYKPAVFPTLYQQMEEKLPDNIIIIKSIYDEIELVSGITSDQKLRDEHPVRFWLQKILSIPETPLDKQVRNKSSTLMIRYETAPSETSRGASKQDIDLISYASIHDKTVVTQEAEQKQKPRKKSNYKIPLICEIEQVRCINFITFLEELNIEV